MHCCRKAHILTSAEEQPQEVIVRVSVLPYVDMQSSLYVPAVCARLLRAHYFQLANRVST